MTPSPAHVRFWNWFKDNGDRLAEIVCGPDRDAREEAMNELSAAAREAEDGLVLEMAAADEGGIRTLVVSADGKHQLVDAVKDFVAAAPRVPGWSVVAFRSRDDVSSFEIALADQRLSAADVWFVVRPSENGLSVTLSVRGLTDQNRQMRGLGATLLAQHAVGELDTLTLLDALDIEPPGRAARLGASAAPGAGLGLR